MSAFFIESALLSVQDNSKRCARISLTLPWSNGMEWYTTVWNGIHSNDEVLAFLAPLSYADTLFDIYQIWHHNQSRGAKRFWRSTAPPTNGDAPGTRYFSSPVMHAVWRRDAKFGTISHQIIVRSFIVCSTYGVALSLSEICKFGMNTDQTSL